MRKTEVDAFKNKLLYMRGRITGEVMHLTDEAFRGVNGESAQPIHMAELGTDVHEQEVTIQMLETEEDKLDEINAAIDRANAGKFGICEGCEKPIPKPRLNAIPYVRLCVECAKVKESGK